MDPGTMISAGTGAYGLALNLYSDSENRRVAGEQAQATNELSERNVLRNIEMQREFAKNGIRWKVEDAKAAGIHPLYALGASGASFSPVSSVFDGGPGGSAGGDLAKRLADSGQNVSRAILASATADEQEMSKERIRGMKLDNEYKAAQLALLNQNSVGGPGQYNPGIPGQNTVVNKQPSKLILSEPGRAGIQAGAINSLQYSYDGEGNLTVVPSEQMKERIEDDLIGETMWHIKNRINPPAPNVKDYPLPAEKRKQGYKYWLWHPFFQKFIPSKNP